MLKFRQIKILLEILLLEKCYLFLRLVSALYVFSKIYFPKYFLIFKILKFTVFTFPKFRQYGELFQKRTTGICDLRGTPMIPRGTLYIFMRVPLSRLPIHISGVRREIFDCPPTKIQCKLQAMRVNQSKLKRQSHLEDSHRPTLRPPRTNSCVGSSESARRSASTPTGLGCPALHP